VSVLLTPFVLIAAAEFGYSWIDAEFMFSNWY